MTTQVSTVLPIRRGELSAVIPERSFIGTEAFVIAPPMPATGSTGHPDGTGETLISSDCKQVELVPSTDRNTVSVAVSGHFFSLDQRIFHQLKKLPWKSDGGRITLRASPELFEIIVNFLLFKMLPNAKLLSSHDKEELENMVQLLDLTELACHIMGRNSFRNFRKASNIVTEKESFEKKKTSISLKSRDDLPQEIKLTSSQDTGLTDEISEDTNTSGEQLHSPRTVETKEEETNKTRSHTEKSSKKFERAGSLRNSFQRAFSRSSSSNKMGSLRSSGSSSIQEKEWFHDVVS